VKQARGVDWLRSACPSRNDPDRMHDAGDVAQEGQKDVEPELASQPTVRKTPTGGSRMARRTRTRLLMSAHTVGASLIDPAKTPKSIDPFRRPGETAEIRSGGKH
jgi:hypothetical protein